MSPSPSAQWVEIQGRRVRLTNLDRVLYPGGFTKAEMISYYTAVAPVLLAQLRNRPVTRIRFPEGVGGERFFEKNTPRGAPAWLRHQALPASPGSQDQAAIVDFPFLDDLAGLVWAANAGAIELHTPQWRVGPRGKVHNPDRLVIDLDPGPPAGLDVCAPVAHLVAERLAQDGLGTAFPVTSGSKGMQLYVPLDRRRSAPQVRDYARTVAHELAAAHPDRLVATQTKTLRPGKVLLDWSQNNPAKTTITPYSLRGREQPFVAAPRHWDEVDPAMTQLGPEDVVRRLETDGDLLADLADS